MAGKPGRHKAVDASQASWSQLCAIEAELGAEKAKKLEIELPERNHRPRSGFYSLSDIYEETNYLNSRLHPRWDVPYYLCC